MNQKKVGEVFEFVRNGVSIKQSSDKGGYPITRIETIWNKTIDKSKFGYADIFKEDLIKYEKYLLEDGDILMSHINSFKYLGKCAIYENQPDRLIHGMNLLCLRANKKISDPHYLKYFFNSNFFKSQVPKISNQSVNQASFSAGNLKELIVKLPSLVQQQKIAKILDAAAALKQKSQEVLDKYDELVQSIFLEMFGDPVTNSKGWDVLDLKSLTDKIGSGATPRGGKESYLKSGISLVRSLNIHDNKFKLKDLAFIDEKQAKRLNNVTLEPDDVLINITGASVARCTIIPSNILPARVNQHVSILRPVKNKLNSVFLLHLLISKNCKLKLLGVGSSNAATRESITKSQLEDFEIPLPPFDIQDQFAHHIKNIEQQKAKAQKSLQKAENLFNALLQKAFKGELIK